MEPKTYFIAGQNLTANQVITLVTPPANSQLPGIGENAGQSGAIGELLDGILNLVSSFQNLKALC